MTLTFSPKKGVQAVPHTGFIIRKWSNAAAMKTSAYIDVAEQMGGGSLLIPEL